MQGKQGPRTGREKLFHRLFEIGIWIKGIDGVIEIVGGILLLAVSLEAINSYVIAITQREIQEDSGDLIANALRHAAHRMTSGSKHIAGAYLLGNGVVKVFLATCILSGQVWSYPVAIVVMTIFIGLQCCRLAFHFSWTMLFATLVDVAIVLLIWREYRRLEANKKPKVV
jgi:uncharacterized membrane protein